MADLSPSADWPTQAADALEQAVTLVRDKTVVPAQKATKAVVYGLLVGFFLFTAVTLLIIGLFRGLVILTGEVWLAYLICGGILVLLGAFCWTRRLKAPKADAADAA
jgi:Putative Actinobacterial Holin-X, holin superfamily III